MNTLILILLVIIGIGAVIADIRSADRALYFRMQKGDKA